MADKIEIQLEEQWKSIGISNDFIFGKVMQDTELLEELVRNILPDLKFEHYVRSISLGKVATYTHLPIGVRKIIA